MILHNQDNYELLNKYVRQINELLDKALDVETGYADYLLDAMKYSVTGGGKRLRPILMQESCKLFSDPVKELPYFMAALEFIHSYSLVHDDMPCIDNDEYRRGRKTTHAVYGETTALLAGDGLLNFAYETAARAFSVTDDYEKCGKAITILAKMAGIFGMVGGQALDVKCEKTGEELNEDKLLFIHENKTAALIESALMIGAVLGGASEEDTKKLMEVGSDIGIAFQIRDDILDIEGDFEQFGKPIGSDNENNKLTYVSLYGMEKAKTDVLMYSKKAQEILRTFPRRNEFLEWLVEELINRNK
ncbi:MAG: polyprenyl synthetase family protein [Lachnospiraceae bacterium]|nr:polyprenyl synthetase family protein [Lachnospiraceae bacterium]